MNGELEPSAVQAVLRTKWLGQKYHYFHTIDSTNIVLEQMVTAGNSQDPPEGTILIADFQSHGRGRLGRSWLAPPGTSLLFSCLFRPDWPARQGHWLTMIASLATVEAIEAITPLNVAVKWPNDLVIEINGEWHKTGGLLLQANIDENGRLASAIMGIGININIPHDRLPEALTPATSLRAAIGHSVSRLNLLTDLLKRVETGYEAAIQGHSPQSAWRSRLITLGRHVEVKGVAGQPTVAGVAEDIDSWGHLLVKDTSGEIHTISAGDVTLRGKRSHLGNVDI